MEPVVARPAPVIERASPQPRPPRVTRERVIDCTSVAAARAARMSRGSGALASATQSGARSPGVGSPARAARRDRIRVRCRALGHARARRRRPRAQAGARGRPGLHDLRGHRLLAADPRRLRRRRAAGRLARGFTHRPAGVGGELAFRGVQPPPRRASSCDRARCQCEPPRGSSPWNDLRARGSETVVGGRSDARGPARRSADEGRS